jgi:hypothetical protein
MKSWRMGQIERPRLRTPIYRYIRNIHYSPKLRAVDEYSILNYIHTNILLNLYFFGLGLRIDVNPHIAFYIRF